jgi:hypothetical protein
MIIGGVAVIAAGVPRQTVDIDATIRGRDSDLASVVARTRAQGPAPSSRRNRRDDGPLASFPRRRYLFFRR